MATKKKPTKNKPVKKAKPAKKAKTVKKAKAVKKSKPAKKAIAKKTAKPKAVVKKPTPKKTVKKQIPKPVKKAAPKKAVVVKSSASKSKAKFSRYTDKELNEFKALLMAKLTDAKERLQEYQNQITRKDDHGTDDTENRFVNMEDGTSTIEREIASQMAARTRQYIENLEKALLRIQNKSYGICVVTGKLISKERLLANPIATKTVEAKEQEKKMIVAQPMPDYPVQQKQEQEFEQE